MKLSAIYTIICIILGAATLGGGSWAAWELRQEVSDNTSWRVIQTFERLSAIKRNRRLTQLEWVKWCRSGRDLHVFISCPHR